MTDYDASKQQLQMMLKSFKDLLETTRKNIANTPKENSEEVKMYKDAEQTCLLEIKRIEEYLSKF